MKCATEILDGANFEYQEFVEHIQTEEINASERGAILKALSRCQSTDCGEMMKSLTTKLGGEGGGHDGAAGWSGKSDRVAAESSFINLLANQKRVKHES